jgi:gamma-glutamyl:cysteine ligase YbdK (ATP-grasp superfamily)
MRFGLDADVVDAETGEVMPMPDYVRKMLAVARPSAAALGTGAHLETLEEILRSGNEASAQRALLRELGGDLRRLQLALLERAREIGIHHPETIPA